MGHSYWGNGYLITPDENTFFSNGEWIRYLLLARMLRLIRLLLHVQRYRAFIATFITLIPSLMPYLGTIFCVLCIYCSIGVQVFGGLVNAGNKQLFKTELAEDDYLFMDGELQRFDGDMVEHTYFVVAFVLEAFFAELDLEEEEKCQGEDSQERRNRRRSAGTKSRSQRVDTLLHHMLGDELSKPECSTSDT
ncbi:unnamed protein product [Arabidopsis arenosa]|uniref:Ion transport domain-containing protein n=1 Tax=Arabidopsis arenosa TaxID=38785 RepID=A0A8S2ALC8_ARAAE|nr:unnamed protein product [Arabidopsis arenosa]